MHPRREVPRQSERFAALNPRHGPYEWLSWSNTDGAEVMPHVSAFQLHDLLDAIEEDVLAKDPSFARFIEPRTPSPWERGEYGWFPTRVDE
jgi:hypothetical protein